MVSRPLHRARWAGQRRAVSETCGERVSEQALYCLRDSPQLLILYLWMARRLELADPVESVNCILLGERLAN